MTIRLQNIEMQAYHGVFPYEREQGNMFRVNVRLCVPDVPAMETDELADTIDYQSVYDIVRHEMAVPSQLLEHVAYRIKKALEQAFANSEAHVEVLKKNPPLGGQVEWAGVEV